MSAGCALWQCLAWSVCQGSRAARHGWSLDTDGLAGREKPQYWQGAKLQTHPSVWPLCLSVGENRDRFQADGQLCVQEQRRMIRQLDLMGIWVLNTSGHYHLWPVLYIKPIYHSVLHLLFYSAKTALSPGQSEGNTFCIFTIWTACLVLNALILSTFFIFSYFYEGFFLRRDWYKIEMIILSANSNNIEVGTLVACFSLLTQFMHLKFTFIYNNFSFVKT